MVKEAIGRLEGVADVEMRYEERRFVVTPKDGEIVKASALRGAVPERFDVAAVTLSATGTVGTVEDVFRFTDAGSKLSLAVKVKTVKDEEQQKKLQETYDALLAAVKEGAKKIKIEGDATDDALALSSFSVVGEFEWYCPMHLSIVRPEDGEKCPICEMPLVKRKVKEE